MSYHGLGLTRPQRNRPHAPQVFTVAPRTYADVWRDPNPSGEVATGRFRDLLLPVAFQRQLQAELDARERGMGELPYIDCTPILIAGGTGTACVDENLRRQQENFKERNADARAGFLDTCNDNWALQDAQLQALGKPRPANTCGQRNFGITPEGGATGSPIEAPIPVTYLPAPVQTYLPAPAASAAIAPAPSPAPPVPAVAPRTGGYVAAPPVEDQYMIGDGGAIGGGGIPWGVIAAVGAGALFLFGGRR